MAKRKTVKIPISSVSDYVTIFSGLFGLTEKEIEVLAYFIRAKLRLEEVKMEIDPFSTNIRKRVAEKMGYDKTYTINSHVRNLSKKKAIKKSESGYKINPILIPRGEKEIVFEVVDVSKG